MSSISVRAERCLEPKQYYFSRIYEAIADAWSEDNPDGFIMAAVAENVVSAPLLLERIQSNATATAIPLDVLKYSDMRGREELRIALASLLQRTIMSGMTVSSDNIILSPGLSSVLDNLFFLLCDAGASCLVPAPYYPMFDQDLGLRSEVRTIPVHLDANGVGDIATLDAEKRAGDAARKPVRAILLTRPDNPTGIIMSEDRMKAIFRWALKLRIHCVIDEAYAFSVFPSVPPFRSAMAIALEVAEGFSPEEAERFWEHVHVVFALSKDFCGSGLRVGALYSHNAQLLSAYQSIAHMSTVSNLTQWQLIQLFEDTNFIDGFISANGARLEASCSIVTDGLTAMGVPYTQPQAGFFVWMHLATLIGIDSWQREQEIWEALFDSAKIYVVPGKPCHAKEPGSYRICFASHPPEAMHDMLARLQHFLDQYRVAKTKQSWDTQGYMLAAGFGSRVRR